MKKISTIERVLEKDRVSYESQKLVSATVPSKRKETKEKISSTQMDKVRFKRIKR